MILNSNLQQIENCRHPTKKNYSKQISEEKPWLKAKNKINKYTLLFDILISDVRRIYT